MKTQIKPFLLVVAMLALSLPTVAQDTVYGVFPHYYYNWYRYITSGFSHDDAPVCAPDAGVVPVIFDTFLLSSPSFYNQNSAKPEIAIEMHPDTALKVLGIACVNPGRGFYNHYGDGTPFDYLDSAPSYFYHRNGYLIQNIGAPLNQGLITVHYNVYDKNMTLIHTQSQRMDSAPVSRYINFGLVHIGYVTDFYCDNFISNFLPVEDIYFDTPLTLSDTFYISRTMTYADDTTVLFPALSLMKEFHPYGGSTCLFPFEKRRYRDTLLTGTWHDEQCGWHVTGLFPIISRDGDSCPQVRDVQFFKGSPTQFFLRWGRGENHHDWQVSLCPLGTAPEDGTLYTFADPITSLITVDPDSQYVAYVRARCRFALDEWGPWSDPVDVWLNNPNTGIDGAVPVAFTLSPNPASGTVTLVSQATDGTLEIVDIQGRTVLAVPAARRTLDISRLPSGSYIVRLTTPQGTATHHLHVE